MRARITLVVVCALLLAPRCLAQNLVPNGSFEEYTECPDYWNQMNRATGWSKYRGSPDYFNSCDTGIFVSVPNNVVGQQDAATGQGYAGVYLWCEFPGDSREHLGAMLLEPLVPGVPVSVSFKVAPATNGFAENMMWSVQRAGLRFTMEPYLQNGLDPLPDTAALFMAQAPLDTSTWQQVSGIYTPDSAYQYVVLGNFFSDVYLLPELLNPNANYPCSYVYIDDVCVSQVIGDCGMSNGVWTVHAQDGIYVSPIPFQEQFLLRVDEPSPSIREVALLDVLGHRVWHGQLEPGLVAKNYFIPTISSGTYLLRVGLPEGASTTVRVFRATH